MDVHRKDNELPAHEVHLSAYWMDQVEVTNGMYNLCVQAGVCRPPAQSPLG
jgi:formylglycine-generating enzyme required for sulfatase activity